MREHGACAKLRPGTYLVLIVYGRVGCDRKFNSKTCRKTIVNFNENTDK